MARKKKPNVVYVPVAVIEKPKQGCIAKGLRTVQILVLTCIVTTCALSLATGSVTKSTPTITYTPSATIPPTNTLIPSKRTATQKVIDITSTVDMQHYLTSLYRATATPVQLPTTIVQPTKKTATAIPISQPTSAPILQPTAIPQDNTSSSCPGFQYTCKQLTCQQAYACLAAGNTKLDIDGDGKPCEVQCRGH